MPNREIRIPRHRPMHRTRRQMRTQLPIIGIRRHRPNHIRRINIFQRAHHKRLRILRPNLPLPIFKRLQLPLILLPLLLGPLITIFRYTLFEELTNILK